MSRPIPIIRKEMQLCASEIRKSYPCSPLADKLECWAEDMWRKSPVSVAPKKIRKMTAGTAEAIRAEHRNNPNLSQLDLARLFDTNPGRVSEALNMKV